MMSAGMPVRIMLSDATDSAEAMVGFKAGGRRLTTRLLAGEFIKYRSRFPAEFDCVADLPAEAFTEAVRRVSLVAERGTPVQLSFGPGQVTIVAATQGQARARETVHAEFSGEEPAIAFSPHYLLDGVVAAASGAGAGDTADADPARVRLRFAGPSKPAVITPLPDARPGGRGEGRGQLPVPRGAAARIALARPGAVRGDLGLLPATLPGRARVLVMDVVPAVVGEQQRGEQPDEHRDQQQRHGGELADVVAAAAGVFLARPVVHGRRGPRRQAGGRPAGRRQVCHHVEELAPRPCPEDLAEPIVKLVESESPGRVVLAQLGRCRVSVGVPDQGHVPGLADT